MTIKKGQSKRQSKKQLKQQSKAIIANNNLSGKKALSCVWKVFAGFAVILGVYSVLYPKPAVSPSTYLDPSDPLKSLFTVSNDGFISLHNVQASCAIRRITLSSGQEIKGEQDFSTRLFNPSHSSKVLAAGETNTIFCPLGTFKLPFPVASADIAIVVDFSTFGFHWPNRIFPFTTQKDINGNLHWIKHPLNK